MASAFSHIEPNVAGHFRLNFYAAVYRVVLALRRIGGGDVALEKTLREHPFLARYLEQILPHLPDGLAWDDMLPWWQGEIAAWESDCKARLPLVALSREGSLTFTGRLALMVVALAEEDSRFGTMFEALQRPLISRRPSLELVGHLLQGDGGASDTDGWSICRGLVAAGLIEVVDPELPRSEWTLTLPAPVWDVIRGEHDRDLLPGCQFLRPENFPEVQDLLPGGDLAERLQRVPMLIDSGTVRALVVKGMPGSDQLRVIGAIARTLGCGLAVVPGSAQKPGDGRSAQHPTWRLLGPLCVMGRFLPVFVYDLTPGETADVPAMPGYTGPVGIVLGLEGGIGGAIAEAALTLMVPPLSAEQRKGCWQEALSHHAGSDLELLSERFILPAGHIRQTAALAITQATLDQRDIVDIRDVRAACQAFNRQMLDTHAARLECNGTWEDLVVSEASSVRLRDLGRRCRHRERVLQHLGNAFAGGSNRGVRALFTGASGTGKTLAAKILAAELGIDLYRVDLGAIVNKYIGETEKNLHQVLSRAEALDVVLLLDEGDALLGNRTEVKSANDRYANLETNYLLQRLETYQGIVIVTTNLVQNIDRAFQRRMDVVVPFVQPQAEERRAIWRLHLPAEHMIDRDFLEQIVERCSLTGGQIRNAALHAILLAVDDGRVPMRRLHLEAAIRSEYRKAGATCPLDGDSIARRPAGVAAFLEVMRS